MERYFECRLTICTPPHTQGNCMSEAFGGVQSAASGASTLGPPPNFKSHAMQELPQAPHVNDAHPERRAARAHYFKLRDRLVDLRSEPQPDTAAIDDVVQELEKAQLAFKATQGLFGNNPLDDATPRPHFEKTI